ncbi:hypothetical protein LLS47_21285 [Rouxiella badensis]|uniref:DUF2570 domain-containing protein n=1 Tax=Rouxiella silvae TaxID=1646373 RepID=A0AA41BX79_9GAMM|nr:MULTISPECIES: hypothetical protein [Rouxiella]MBF6637891.1 hypothetical protein [Rouxiella silvae]MCC3735467.1 hypothetical protein [Rouxiella badensis]MCC3760764.1 hypothetical protein [Rouxiella badensis]
MADKIYRIATLVMLACMGLLMWIAFHYYGKSVAQADSLATAVQQKNEAEFITKSQALSVGIFNQIAGATLDVQKANVSASQDRQVIIKTVLKADACAVQPVHAAAAGSLLEHYNAIRKGSTNADTGKSAGTVRGIPAA